MTWWGRRCTGNSTDHVVDVRLPADLPPVVVDAKLIVQVFTNLFDNIAKYTPARHARDCFGRPRGQVRPGHGR